MASGSLLRRAVRWGRSVVSGSRPMNPDCAQSYVEKPAPSPAPSGTPAPSAAPAPSGAAPPVAQPSIILEAAAGQTALGIFLVENHLATPVNGAIVVSPVSAPDAGAIELPFALDPPVAALNPLDRVLARLSLVMPDHLAPGVAYAGHIAIPALSSASIPLVVRRLEGA